MLNRFAGRYFMNAKSTNQVPPEVRAAIGAFLNECQEETRPFAVSEALGAIRRIFPDLDISDADLLDVLTLEASHAGYGTDFDAPTSPETIKRRSHD
jgi:hypothetical protein